MLTEPKCHPELMKMGKQKRWKRNAIVGLDGMTVLKPAELKMEMNGSRLLLLDCSKGQSLLCVIALLSTSLALY